MSKDKDKEKEIIAKDSLKSAEEFIKKTKQAKDNAKQISDLFGTISTQLFGISGSAFFTEVKKSREDLINLSNNIKDLEKDRSKTTKYLAEETKKHFSVALNQLQELSKFEPPGEFKKLMIETGGEIQKIEDLQNKIRELEKEGLKDTEKYNKYKEIQEKYNEEEKKHQESLSGKFKEIINTHEGFLEYATEEQLQKFETLALQGDINKSLEKGGDFLQMIVSTSEGFKKEVYETNDKLAETNKEIEELNKELNDPNKKVFSLKEAFESITEEFARGIIPNMLEYDKIISNAGKNFGFIDTKSIRTSQTMASLGSEAARFNLGMEDAVNMMGGLGEELKTIDQNYLANSVKHFVAIEKATGISSEEITTIAGEMMRAGKSAEDVENYMEGANHTAKMFGVNTKKVLQGVARNIDKMRQMGFKGGEESLTRMVATAERLRINVDEIFDVAKKARTIEGAMDMAAELQLAGGSFANIDPMSLLAAARKGPEELKKILTQMGGDIGRFNDEGVFEIDAIDADRLQMVADSTGMSVDSLTKMIQKNAEDSKKLNMFQGTLDGLEEADKALVGSGISDMLKISKDGSIEFDVDSDMAKRMGIDSLEELQSMSAEDIKKKMEADAKTLEEQAAANKSFSDSLDSFKQSLLNIFIQFQPILSFLTDAINFLVDVFSTLPNSGKLLVGGLVGAFVLFGTNVGMLITQGVGKFVSGIWEFTKGVKGFAKSSWDFIKNISNKETWKMVGDKIGGTLKKSFIPKGGKNAKGVVDSITSATKPLSDTAGAASKTVADATAAKANSEISKKIDMSGLLKFSAAMALIGLAVASFGYGINKLGGIQIIDILYNGMLTIGLLAAAVWGISKIKIGVNGIIQFSAAMAIVGAAMIPFAFAMNMMAGVDWTTIVASVGMMTLLVLGLAVLGSIITPIAPFLLAGAVALIAVGAMLLLASFSLLIAASAFEKLAEINWDGLSNMGSALMSTVPGLLAFSLASMMFLNPLSLLGMIAMTATLGGLAVVMIPLGDAMIKAADGMERFAGGLEKLQQAASNLDFERLEALKDLSMGMAVAGVGGGVLGDQIKKIAEALAMLSNSNGGGSGGGTKKFEINLKLNGRQLQEIIIDDTEIVS